MEKQELLKMLEQVQKRELHYLEAEKAMNQKDRKPAEVSGENHKIAVIGYSCRFPSADNADEFWSSLISGRDCITEIPANRWPLEGFYDPDSDTQSDTSYSKWGGFLNSIAAYDLGLLHMTKQEALSLDPQQLLAMEVAREALEYSGYGNIREEHSNTGVFIGARSSNITLGMLQEGVNAKEYKTEDNRNYIIGKAPNMIASRISDFLNLKGPSMIIDTACSSSLVSIHMACKSLLAGDCTMALAGGIDLLVNSDSYVGLSKSKAISPDGKCFTFDKRANGYVPGEGAGIVVLKEYAKAVACNDTIYAIIKGSAINNDGHTMGITTPDLEGQKELIRTALKDAKVSTETITYVEAHGTGTVIGDPIEIKALAGVYGESTDKKGFCGVGSVKTNIGHLHCAAGIAGFIKLLLCLKNKTLVPTLNCQMPNKRFDFVDSPFFPVSKAEKWEQHKEKRRAAISSFGFGGTNCHIIVEEHEDNTDSEGEAESYLPFVLSAADNEALGKVTRQYIDFLKGNPEIRFKDAAYTLVTGREIFDYRLFAHAKNTEELVRQLEKFSVGDNDTTKIVAGSVYSEGKKKKIPGKVVAMFTGQGELYTGVARELYETSAVFRSTIDNCSDILLPYLGQSISELLYNPKNAKLLKNTSITQPVTFALDYALFVLWKTYNLPVSVVMGHSLGEYVAACAAGIYELKDMLKIVAVRGRLMGELPDNGTMVAVIASEIVVKELLNQLEFAEKTQVSIAAVNGEANTVISGEKTVIESICENLKQSSIKYVVLQVSHAFHSPLMKPMLDKYRETIGAVIPKPATIKIISNVTADFLKEGDINEEYWENHILNTVQFNRSIEKLISEGYRYFIEMGPGNTLLKLAKNIAHGNEDITICSSLLRDNSDRQQFFQTMGELFVKGAECNLSDFFKAISAKRIALPLYNYKREVLIGEDTSVQDSALNETDSLFDGIISKTAAYVSYFKVLNTKKDRVLRDHRVRDSYVVPGVYQIKLALAGANKLLGKKLNCIENITFVHPINALQNQDLLLRIRIYQDGSQSFQIDSWDKEANRFLSCSHGIYSSCNEKEVFSFDNINNKEEETAVINSYEIYEYMNRIGLQYGDYFKGLKKITVRAQMITGDIYLEANNDSKENEVLHPGVLDAALQVISSKLYLMQSEYTYVPFCISKMLIFNTMTDNHYQSIVKIQDDEKQSEIIKADIKVIDSRQQTVMILSGVCLKKLAVNSVHLPAESRQSQNLLYKPVWAEKSFARYDRNWQHKNLLVFLEEDNQLHKDVIASLKKEDCNIYYIYKSNRVEYGDRNIFRVIQGQQEALLSIIKILKGRDILPDSVLYLWTLDGYKSLGEARKPFELKMNSYGLDMIYLLKAMKDNQLNHPIRILTVTNNCQPVNGGNDVLYPEKSDILGVIKTIPLEFEHISAGNIDFDCGDFKQGRIPESIVKELSGIDEEPFIGYRAEKRFIMSLEKIHQTAQAVGNGLFLRQNGTYIILGGQSGVGIEIIQHLSKKVCANFVVISRSKFPDVTTWGKILQEWDSTSESIKDKIRAYKEILSRGSHLSFYEGDITDYDRMQYIFEDVRRKYSSINGVIHSAGILKDSLILNMDIEKYTKVLKPKVLGAIIADRLTEHDSLDFMILFSGLVSYVGLVGQSNHTAANFFEDNFSYYRNYVKQKRTLTINWGIWGTVGIVAKPMYTQTLEDKGFMPMTVLEALKAFDTVIATDLPQVGIGHISNQKQKEILYHIEDAEKILQTDEAYVKNISGYDMELGRLLEQVDAKYESAFGKALNRLCAVFIMEYLEGNGVFIEEGEEHSAEEVLRRCNIHEKFKKLLEAMIAFAIKEGFISKSDSGFIRNHSKSPEDFYKLSTRFKEEFKKEEIYVIILENCFKHYSEVLAGRMSAMHALFPGGNTNIMERLYHLPSPHNEYIGKLVRKMVASFPENREVKILEIGGGTGGTTAKILPELAGLKVVYTFTDISPVLVKCAKDAFHKYEYVTCFPLDIEKEPKQQSTDLGSYDIIIAANVLHATASLPVTFQNVKQFMNKEAVLIMMETTSITGFADLVFGITDGWWKFQNTDFRKASTLLSPDKWRETLNRLGFGRVATLPLTERESVRYPYSVIIADNIEMTGSQEESIKLINIWETAADKRNSATIKRETGAGITDKRVSKPASGIKEEEMFEYVKSVVISLITQVAGIDSAVIVSDAGFLEMGLDSLTLVALSGVIEKEMLITLYPTVFFEYQTIDELTKHLCEKHHEKMISYVHEKHLASTLTDEVPQFADTNHRNEKSIVEDRNQWIEKPKLKKEEDKQTGKVEEKEEVNSSQYYKRSASIGTSNAAYYTEDIAIIGMAGIFPGAEDVYQLWNNLKNGIDSIQDINSLRWKDTTIFEEISSNLDTRQSNFDTKQSKGRTYCKWGGLLKDYDKFDPGFFNISVREAKRMDPQQRLFLETAWGAVENGGYPMKRLSELKVGVFAGVSNHNYHSISYDQNDSFCTLSTSNAMVANRFSYFMNLTGPSLTIDTQCSSSMTALNYACRSLLSGECDMAVAGGVNVIIPKEYYVLLSQAKALSADGKCKTFDKSADGFVSGEGAAVLLLKPLSLAVKDKDNIHGVIKGISVTHDGKSSNVSAPNANSQCMAITEALKRAKISPESLAFIEAHGTGTSLGDPVEVSALTKSFEQFTDKKAFCAIGSLKTNIGHLESAAGIAGVIKAVLAIHNRIIPPTIHFNQPNSFIDFNATPFYVADKPVEWKSNQVMRAGISSFGMGGTNCHSILEEAPLRESSENKKDVNVPFHLFTISAKSEHSLWETIEKIGGYIDNTPNLELSDICHTMNIHRNHFGYRIALVVNTKEKLGKLIKEAANKKRNSENLEVHGMYYSFQPSFGESRKPTINYLISDRKFNTYDLQGLRQNLLFEEAFLYMEEIFSMDMNSCISYKGEETLSEGQKEIMVLIIKAVMARILIQYNLRPAYIINSGEKEEITVQLIGGEITLSEAIKNLAESYKVSVYPDTMKYDFQLPLTPVITLEKYKTLMQEQNKESLKEITIEIGPDDYYSDSIKHQVSKENIRTIAIPFLQSDVTNWYSIISLVGNVYSFGTDIDFKAFEELYNGKVVDLPTYVFDHKSYWIQKHEEETVGYHFQKEYIINELKAGNRIVKSGTEIGMAEKDGSINEAYINYYKRWSNIQTGVKILGNFMVDERAKNRDNEVVIGSEMRQTKQLLRLNQLLKEENALLLIQLNYGGVDKNRTNKNLVLKSLSHNQIEEIVQRFIEAAVAVKEGEFDGIQLHAAHGYLLSQFMSSKYNSRSDKFGGSVTNRTDIIKTIVQGIRKALGRQFVISVKLDMPSVDNGVSVEELVEIIRILRQVSVDMIELSAGIVSKEDTLEETVFAEYKKVLAAVKKDIHIPVIVTGGIRKREQIEQLLTTYNADFVGLGRPFICEPAFVENLKGNLIGKSGCSSCSMCFYTLAHDGLRCVQKSRSKEVTSVPYQEYLFEQTWVETESFTENVQNTLQGVYAVFCEDEAKFKALSNCLEARGYVVYRIKDGFGFKEEENTIRINFAQEADYIKLINQLLDKFGQNFNGFIQVALQSDSDSASIELSQDSAVFIQMHLAKAVQLSKTDTIVNLIAVTFNGIALMADYIVNTEHILLNGLNRINPYEVKNIHGLSLDFEERTDTNAFAEAVVSEMTGFHSRYKEVAFRKNCRYERRITGYKGDINSDSYTIEGGVYLITGGLSGLGKLFAVFLIKNKAKAVYLIGRRDVNQISQGKELKELEELSREYSLTRIEYRSADVADYIALDEVVKEMTEKYKTIQGIIHCAGIVDRENRTLRAKNYYSFSRILRPKYEGTINLAKIFRYTLPDFMIFCSSISGTSGKLGATLSDYGTGNFFVDEYAKALANTTGRKVVSISWPSWDGVGLGAKKAYGGEEYSIDRELGLRIFEAVIKSRECRNLVVLNPKSREIIQDFAAVEEVAAAGIHKVQDTINFVMPAGIHSDSISEENRRNVKEFLKSLFVEFLQIEHSQIRDEAEFYEYGIDSVIVADIVAKIEERYKIFLHPSALLEHTSIKSLSEFLIKEFKISDEKNTEILREENISNPEEGIPLLKKKETNLDFVENKISDDADKDTRLDSLLDEIYEGDITVEEALKMIEEV
jgi:polyketide synthase PksM